jgi:replicative DNA helicase
VIEGAVVEGRDLESPPHDDQAEQAILGSVLKNPRAIHEVVDLLAPEAFYNTRNRLVFGAMLALVRQDIAIDYHTIAAELERMGVYERAGGVLHLSEIGLGTPSAAHIEHYGRIVADHHLRRLLIQENQRSAELAWRAQLPIDDLLARTQSAMLGLSDAAGVRTRSTTAAESIERWLEGFDRDSATNDRGDRIVGHSTGLRCLDRITLGLQPARLYLLSAYTSVGKSQLAHQVALHVARHHGPVLMASLEMGDQELTARAIAQETGIPVEALATHEVDEREAAAVLAVAERQSADPLHYMDGSDGLTTSQIRSRALQLQAQLGRLSLIVVDYGQLLQDSKGNNSTVEDQTLVSRNLKRMARALDVPLLVPVQINRQAGARGDQRPKLSDIRESGCVTADTRLLRADTGEPITIGQLLSDGWDGVQVWSLDDHGKMRAARVTRVFASGIKPAFRLQLSSGRSVKASANHRFLTLDGWVELECLRPGARLAIPRIVPEPVGAVTAWNRMRLGLLAHLIGDGCALPTHALQYTNADEANLAFVEQAAREEFGIHPRRVMQENWYHVFLPASGHLTHGRHNPIGAWLRELGVFGLRSYEKHVPTPVFAASNRDVACFLGHLWSTDGRVDDGAAPGVCYDTTSPRLAEDVAVLLQRLGIHARLRRIVKPRVVRPCWRVDVAGVEQVRRFAELVCIHGARQKRLVALIERLEGTRGNPNVDTLPLAAWDWVRMEMREKRVSSRALAAGLQMSYSGAALYKAAPSRARMARVNQVLGSERLAGLLEDDIFWDDVVSIDPLGDQPVFDATVEGTHNFIADGVMAHNSWEQDADVVVGLYRDELVHPDTDDRGLLELIVLKNRHAGEKPPASFKAVWYRGRYGEWDRNSYAERTRIPRGVAAAFDQKTQGSSRLPYAGEP